MAALAGHASARDSHGEIRAFPSTLYRNGLSKLAID
jgi:hypothetical protein